MIRLRRILARLFYYPSTNQALFAIVAWPALFAAACWQTPQIAEFLRSQGLDVSMWQVFHAGFGAYILLLANHRVFNRRHFECNAPSMHRHQHLVEVEQGMVIAGLGGTRKHSAVAKEKAQLRKQLGFLVDADNFYCKLDSVLRISRWLRSKFK
ncbi:hypothetical protein [Pseudomonas viridiflava]|uniref:hypothetical protein n=1 Tax=Pseudomonas viridiflava TaxID=33069 RepID=UPI002EC31CBD|nr:hypothetical protein [Pseudomonas viridiflava]